MSKQMQNVLMLVTLISYVQFAVCSEFNTRTDLEKSMHRLKANMKIFEEQSRNFGMEKFTAFNVTKRGVTVQETLEMYKYLFGILEQDEKITVLTIRNNHLPETDSLEKCLANIVTAAQNHMFEKGNETFFDDECITIECIDREEIVEYEALSKNLGQIEQLKVSVAVYMLDNITELIGGTLKQFVFDLIVDSLNHFFERCFKVEKYSSSGGILRPEAMRAGFLKESTEKIIGDVDNFRWCSLEGMVAKCKNAEIYSIYSVLRLFVVDLEGKNNLSYFGDDEKAIKNSCVDVFNRYSYVFEQITIQMAQKSASHLRSSDDKQLLPSILNYMFDKIEGNNRLDSKTIKKLITVEIRNQIMCQLKSDSSFMNECRFYLRS